MALVLGRLWLETTGSRRWLVYSSDDQGPAGDCTLHSRLFRRSGPSPPGAVIDEGKGAPQRPHIRVTATGDLAVQAQDLAVNEHFYVVILGPKPPNF